MNILNVIVSLAITVLLVFAPITANATLVTWRLNNLISDRGPGPTGSFSVDTTDVAAHPGPGCCIKDYDVHGSLAEFRRPTALVPGEFLDSVIQGNDIVLAIVNSPPYDIDYRMRILFGGDVDLLRGTQGTFPVLGGFETWTDQSGANFGSSIILPGGTVTAAVIPEPSTFPLLSGAAALALLLRRRIGKHI